MKMQPTKCWECAYATDHLCCEWVDGNPVPGWTALPTKIYDNDGDRITVESYVVFECPKFRKEERHKTNRLASDEQTGKLIAAIVNRAIKDWRWADKVQRGMKAWRDLAQVDPQGMKDDVEQFFRGELYGCLCDIDGRKIIEKLKGESK